MEKCEDCKVGFEGGIHSPDGGCSDGYFFTENDYKQKRSYHRHHLKFKFCPDCGHKIDWERLDEVEII